MLGAHLMPRGRPARESPIPDSEFPRGRISRSGIANPESLGCCGDTASASSGGSLQRERFRIFRTGNDSPIRNRESRIRNP